MFNWLVSKYSCEKYDNEMCAREHQHNYLQLYLHREVRQNFSQRILLNYEVTTASSFFLTHKANFCLTYPKHQPREENTASLGTLFVYL